MPEKKDASEPKKKKIIKLKVKSQLLDKEESVKKEKKTQQTTESPKPRFSSENKPFRRESRPGGEGDNRDRRGKPPLRSDNKRTVMAYKAKSSTNNTGSSTTSTTEKSSRHNKDKHKVSTTSKPRNYDRERSKKIQEEVLLNKMQSNLNRYKKGEAVIPDAIEIGEVIKVADLAKKMNLKSSGLIQKLMELGVMATINDTIDSDTAQIVAGEFNCKVNVKSLKEEVEIKEEVDAEDKLSPRPPIVTVMGHVDHGKTKLLDAIRNSQVAEHESGGITQHIGAYKAKTDKGEITFIDTPGHAAFTAMRARGAEVTDIVILVVSAVEGVMPQTIEALNHAKAANVPIVVAINKIDLAESNPDRVKQQLSEQGLIPEEWSGDTMYVPVSALKKQGINELLEAVLLQAEVMELKANPERPGLGYVIESKMDIGKGAVATVVIKNGKIEVGDHFVVGTTMGKVRAMFNDIGEKVDKALPADAVEIMGFTELPQAGEKFYIVESDEFARAITDKRKLLKKLEENQTIKKIQMQNAMDKLSSPDLKELKVIVKADVHGSVEAIQNSLSKLRNDEVKVMIIHSGVGAVSEGDIMLATATANTKEIGVVVMAFRVRVDSIAKDKAESEGITVRRFTIIYELIDYVKSILEGMLAPEVSETVLGSAEIKEIFKISNVGKIAGCAVTDGFIRKNESVRLFREGVMVWEGKIKTLKRFQEDTSEVQSGFECGIALVGFENMKKGDIIECFHSETKEKKFVVNTEDESKKSG